MDPKDQIPTQRQLLLPLLECLQENGGRTTPKEATEWIAEKLEIPKEVKHAFKSVKTCNRVNLLQRQVRWTRQNAVLAGLISATTPKGIWELTEEGNSTLQNALPGVIIRIYETEQGVALWGEAESAAGILQDNSIGLIFTSPPYPLIQQKKYHAKTNQEYLTWLTELADSWKGLLKENGSLMLNLSDTWVKGQPTINLYQEKLLLALQEIGYNLIQRIYWHSPTKMPASHWVTIEKCRLNNSVEHLFWLSPNERPKAFPYAIKKPYSKKMRSIIQNGGSFRQVRPGGHGGTQGGFSRDYGGAIPFTLWEIPHGSENRDYLSFCKEHKLPIHPARFPLELPKRAILLTTEGTDPVYDPMAGSGTTALAAQITGRPWITSEKSLTYLQGSLGNFSHACALS